MLPCRIFSLDEDSDAVEEIEEFTGEDFWDVIQEVERLFRRCGINIASYEEPWSACLTADGQIMGATVLGNAGYLDEDGELEPMPTIRFSVVVDETVRRKGIARSLIQDIVEAYPSGEFVLEAWVINPHMVSLLTEFGFETMGSEWSLNSPMMTRQNPYPLCKCGEPFEWAETGKTFMAGQEATLWNYLPCKNCGNWPRDFPPPWKLAEDLPWQDLSKPMQSMTPHQFGKMIGALEIEHADGGMEKPYCKICNQIVSSRVCDQHPGENNIEFRPYSW